MVSNGSPDVPGGGDRGLFRSWFFGRWSLGAEEQSTRRIDTDELMFICFKSSSTLTLSSRRFLSMRLGKDPRRRVGGSDGCGTSMLFY